MGHLRRRPALAAAAAVFVVAAVALSLTARSTHLALPRNVAIRATLRSPLSRHTLEGARFDHVSVTALDSNLDRVTFSDGSQVVAQMAVSRDGRVVSGESFAKRSIPYGNWIAYQPALLIGLGALFMLVTGVAPWRRLRNLDVAAALSLTGSVVLLQQRYMEASVLAAVPGLVYLMVRCLLRGLGPSGGTEEPSTPLLAALTPGWKEAQRVRLLRLLAVALGLVFVMVTISSEQAVDVVYAVMEGATKLVGGVLPYGHMPGDIVHGDTYPLLSFLAYVPLARLTPVASTWSSVDLALGATALTALGVGWALFRFATGPGRVRTRPPERESAGLQAALAWLAFPPVLVAVSSGTTDVVLAALLLAAVLLWRRPGWATGLLAAGAWFKLAPLPLVAVRLAPLRGRSLAWALLAVGLVTLPLLALLVALGGLGGVSAMVHAVTFQFSRGSPQSVWSGLGIGGLQPVGEAAVLGLIAGAMLRLRRSPELAEDPTRMAGLAAGILIALELAANYWAFLYLLWVVPLVAIALMTERASPVPVPGRSAARIRLPDPSLAGAR